MAHLKDSELTLLFQFCSVGSLCIILDCSFTQSLLSIVDELFILKILH